MPLYTSPAGPASASEPYTAVVAVPAFNASATIEATLASIAESLRFYRTRRGTSRAAISIVDDASTDATVEIITAFARTCIDDVYLVVNRVNRGRAWARNRALAAVHAHCCLFLDHDDEYLPEHIDVCLDALRRHPRADYVKTGVVLSDPVHSDWEPRIVASLTQNLCVWSRCHRLIGGFHEAPEVETYGCDDLLYNRTLRTCFRGLDLPQPTVKFRRRPGNSFDRQYERKFTRPEARSEITLSRAQQQVAGRVFELHDRRVDAVRARIGRLASVARGLRPPRPRRHSEPLGELVSSGSLLGRARDLGLTAPPFSDDGDRIYAVMVTGKSRARAALADASVVSFLLQEYGNRALVVVNDGDDEVDLSDVPGNRVTCLRPDGRRTLGELRNLALDAVPEGAIWTYWDDDDWHHPRLMAAQRAVLSRLNVRACFLRNQVKYSFPTDAAFVDRHPGGFAGTLLAVKHPNLRFPSLPAGEDSVYTAALKSRERWFPWDNPPHYLLRFFHGANTWSADHFGFADRAQGRWQVSARTAEHLRVVLPLYAGRPVRS